MAWMWLKVPKIAIGFVFYGWYTLVRSSLYACKVSSFVHRKAGHIVVSIALAQYKQHLSGHSHASQSVSMLHFAGRLIQYNNNFILMS